MQRRIIEKGTTTRRFEGATVTVHAPRDITLAEWEIPLQKYLSAREKGKAVKPDAA